MLIGTKEEGSKDRYLKRQRVDTAEFDLYMADMSLTSNVDDDSQLSSAKTTDSQLAQVRPRNQNPAKNAVIALHATSLGS